jgi:UDP-N-acetylmuramate: L-alanyl-gamma-D-glutamyl-meso-diaminopimelate ligase
MHIHILGICGTFMGGIASLARALGHTVTGCDLNVYPPMSTLLEAEGIKMIQGYEADQLDALKPDLVIIGNALSRGKPIVEAVLNRQIPYTSGPQWLGEVVLQDRFVMAVSGTHGKTTTTSLLAWILECAGMSPGFLVGGNPLNFGVSARLGDSSFFVIEADEYDTAFFDKRSKFVHYRPRTCIVNNLEFDHADIFTNIEAIQQQFHHLIRTVPSEGQIICRAGDGRVSEVLAKGCWTPVVRVGSKESSWYVDHIQEGGHIFTVYHEGQKVGGVEWDLLGHHNIENALVALAAAKHAGIAPEVALEGLRTFRSVARRLELKGEVAGVRVYDDFAHHPTAIATTLAGLRAKSGAQPIWAIVDLRSNTMKQGIHRETLAMSLQEADRVLFHQGDGVQWDLAIVASGMKNSMVFTSVEDILAELQKSVSKGVQVVVMSNGGFGGLPQKLLDGLSLIH